MYNIDIDIQSNNISIENSMYYFVFIIITVLQVLIHHRSSTYYVTFCQYMHQAYNEYNLYFIQTGSLFFYELIIKLFAITYHFFTVSFLYSINSLQYMYDIVSSVHRIYSNYLLSSIVFFQLSNIKLN